MENWELTWTKLVLFNKESIESLPNDLPGVYRLSYEADDGDRYVFYVGQSENIRDRLLEHLSSDEENVCIKNYLSTKKCFFRYAEISEASIRNATERQTYKHYEPACNDKEPEGRDDIKLNLS